MDLMEFLYRVMEELSNAGIPIVFKGAMVLNLIIRENNPSRVERMTKDIDGDWVGEFPTMEEMEKALQNAVKVVDSSLNVQINRTFVKENLQGLKLSKIYAVSGQNVCRRVKDVLDIYVMSFITQVNTDELYEIWKETDRELGNFGAYKAQMAELSKAYDKMKGVKNKPDFIDVYQRVNDIVCNFEP